MRYTSKRNKDGLVETAYYSPYQGSPYQGSPYQGSPYQESPYQYQNQNDTIEFTPTNLFSSSSGQQFTAKLNYNKNGLLVVNGMELPELNITSDVVDAFKVSEPYFGGGEGAVDADKIKEYIMLKAIGTSEDYLEEYKETNKIPTSNS